MFHPLIKLLATRPDLLAQHLWAYAQLATVQADQALLHWRRAALLRAALVVALLLGLLFLGFALLVLSALPWHSLNAPWLMLAVPGVPLLLAAGLGLRIQSEQRSGPGILHNLRGTFQAQFEADAQLMTDAAQR